MATNAELLEKVNTAIEAILDGGAVQSYTVSGKNLQKYSLSELMALQQKLQSGIAMTSAKRSTVIRFNPAE